MTESGHRRRTSRRGRLSGVPLDQFTAELLGLICAEVQRTSGREDVQRTGFGSITVTVNVHNHEFTVAGVRVDTSSRPDDG